MPGGVGVGEMTGVGVGLHRFTEEQSTVRMFPQLGSGAVMMPHWAPQITESAAVLQQVLLTQTGGVLPPDEGQLPQ